MAAFGAGQLLVTLNLWNDFNFKSYRLRTEVDSGAKNHATFYLAAASTPRPGCGGWRSSTIAGRQPGAAPGHVPSALAVAYAKTNHPKLAEASLNTAERLDPDAPEIWEVRRQLFPKD
jgi:hypothetical protein